MEFYYSDYETWASIKNEKSKVVFFFLYLFAKKIETLAIQDFLRHPIKDIERILRAHVLNIIFCPLRVGGCIGTPRRRKLDRLKYWIIFIRSSSKSNRKLVTFVHEILHLKLMEFGVLWCPNEERLDLVAIHVVSKYKNSVKNALFDFCE